MAGQQGFISSGRHGDEQGLKHLSVTLNAEVSRVNVDKIRQPEQGGS